MKPFDDIKDNESEISDAEYAKMGYKKVKTKQTVTVEDPQNPDKVKTETKDVYVWMPAESVDDFTKRQSRDEQRNADAEKDETPATPGGG